MGIKICLLSNQRAIHGIVLYLIFNAISCGRSCFIILFRTPRQLAYVSLNAEVFKRNPVLEVSDLVVLAANPQLELESSAEVPYALARG
jgi:hypothetical protein